jgi:esterase
MRVIFVHGFLGSALNWGPVVTKLSANSWIKENNVILEAYDLLGHGTKTNVSKTELQVSDLGQDLYQEIMAKGNQSRQIIGVGHSFGVRPLLWISNQKPEFFKSLVVEDSSPVVSDQGFQELNSVFDKVKPPFGSRIEARACIEKEFGVDSKMSRFLLTGIRENDKGLFDWRYNVPALRHLLRNAWENPQWREWSNYTGHISMIMGAESSFVSLDRQNECLSKRSKGKTSISQIDRAGHWVHSDQLVQFCDEMVKCIKNEFY